MLRIARSTLRVRWASLAGSFLALALGVALLATTLLVITATGHLTDRPQRYSAAPAVLLPDTEVSAIDSSGAEQRLPAADQPGLTPALVATVARTGRTVTDRTFAARLPGGPRDQVGHAWSAAQYGGYRLTAGRAPAADGEVVVGGGDPASVGRSLTLLTAAGPTPVTVTGVTAPVTFEHALFLTDAQAERISPAVNALIAYGPPDQLARAVAGAPVALRSGPDLALADPNRAAALGQLDGVTTPLGLAAAVAVLVAGFVVAGTFAFSVAQRRRELALLRLIGAGRHQLRRLVRYEALLVGLAASAAGCVLALAAAPLLGRWLVARALVPTGFSVPPSGWALLAAAVTGLLIATTGVLVSSWRAGRVGPLEALREAAVERDGRAARVLRAVGGGFALLAGLAVAGAIALWTPQYAANAGASASLALWISGAFVVLAGVLARPLVRLLAGRGGSRGRFVWRAARAGVLGAAGRTLATVTPVVIVIGLSGCLLGSLDAIDSAKVAATRDQLAGTDFLVLPAGGPTLSRAAVDQVRAVPGTVVLTVTPSTLFTLQDGAALIPAPVAEVDPAALAAVSRTPVLAGSLADLGADSVALSRDWPGSAKVGQRIALWRADGTPATLRVAALLASTGGPATAYLPLAGSDSTAPVSVAYVQLAPGADRSRTAAALDRAARGTGARVLLPAQVAAGTRDANVEQSRTGLELILGLGLVYAVIALANTLVMTVADRRRELALLRLAGATRTQVVAVVTVEALICVGAGALLGALAAAVSVGGSWAALRRLVGDLPLGPLLADGPWSTLGALTALCVLVALVAAALPAALALRTSTSPIGSS
ncbi:putative ABC transport system permease protein [Kitasatospora sp. MAA4]|uniref:FtsX-like permease family protein n=1 Tax=Kitasatospora sp. MAA4 TaxID=3035093 RepID=UPI00247429D9|nr:FtsX-like permease family protein [Kitasatospora sp. MAA4]MDH6130880.1 putative ABC transport system permease protein [Kitasatospora sp. MAA4]